MNETPHPRVGIAVIVKKDGNVLLGKRKAAIGNETWQFPGGHLEYGEGIFECALREVLEETGAKIHNLSAPIFTNDVFKENGKHYLNVYVVADYLEGAIEVKEPDKCEVWEWIAWSELPNRKLFVPIYKLFEMNFSPFNT